MWSVKAAGRDTSASATEAERAATAVVILAELIGRISE
jgi:hypothetical protein